TEPVDRRVYGDRLTTTGLSLSPRLLAATRGLCIVTTLVPAATPTAPLVLFAGRLGTLLRRGLLLRGRILPAGLTPGGLLGRSFLRGSLLG
ncbi:hypothetical protein, partial [Klebsiella pneumoniae]